MQALILGLVALVIALIALRGFTVANPAVMARQLKLAGGILALLAAALFFVRGGINQALVLGLIGAWLLGWRGLGSWGGFPGGFPGSARKSPGQSSRVATDHLEMELDHDTGAMTGRVRKGMFQGRSIESLKPAELALLWQDCRFSDPQSAQILEAYLDRVHPTWREDVARGEREMRGTDGRMSAEEAYSILGLAPGASEEDVRRAHRELMLKLHPDRGGSTYLAAQINEAKDVLLGL
jgi:DnaJ domain